IKYKPTDWPVNTAVSGQVPHTNGSVHGTAYWSGGKATFMPNVSVSRDLVNIGDNMWLGVKATVGGNAGIGVAAETVQVKVGNHVAIEAGAAQFLEKGSGLTHGVRTGAELKYGIFSIQGGADI